LHEKFLEPAWKEFNLRSSYWKSALINIGGFVPFGFFGCAYISITRARNRAALATVVLGTIVSLTIEVLQAYLPTRDSGTTDLITNTLGTGLGVMFYRWKPSMLTAILDRIPLTTRIARV
jgi:glycopeptide antibiotics resistance protein